MKSSIILACALALLAAPAMAENSGNGKGKGKGKSHKTQTHMSAPCPPGLAKKSPRCIPPGQARKAERSDDRPIALWIDDRYYHVGDRLDEPAYHYVTRPRLYGLEPLYDGSRYVIVGNNLMRVDGDTLQLLSLIRIVDSILD